MPLEVFSAIPSIPILANPTKENYSHQSIKRLLPLTNLFLYNQSYKLTDMEMMTIKKRSIFQKINCFLNFFIGVGAFIGSLMAFIPTFHESMGLSTALLKYAPFETFLIPGLFLLVVLCGLNFLNGILFLKNKPAATLLSVFMGLILMAWIVIQCLVMWMIIPIQVIFFLLGLVQFSCSIYSLKKLKI